MATQQLVNNKTPGPDGIPVEVYKLYPKLVRLLHKTWLKEHDITGSMEQSNMVLVYKGKGEQEEMANYRPLQMLNTDYKIVTKTLANRLQGVIQQVIHPDQTGFIKGRNIKDNIVGVFGLMTINYIPTVYTWTVDSGHCGQWTVDRGLWM